MWVALPVRTLLVLLLAVVLIFGVPIFFALAGPTVHVASEEDAPPGLSVDFDPAACAELPAPEDRLCDYGDLFDLAGREAEVDPRLLAAVAHAESGYRADVAACARDSVDGAQGLMQFMPATAEERGVDPCDAASAIFGAARYLRDLYDELGPVASAASDPSERYRWELAVAGYNAGPQGVRDAGGIPRNGETERYVPQVMRKWDEYKGLFPGTGGVGGCPVPAPRGSTAPIETDNDHVTPATRVMANAVLECFGRGGRPVWCYDPRVGDGGRYEHPRGRACDFMITGGGHAEGDDRDRGQAMAEWLVASADELDLLYVIWYRRIWEPSMGDVPWDRWRPYGGPSPHTDHVHVSVKLMPGDPSWAACPHDSCSGPEYGVPR